MAVMDTLKKEMDANKENVIAGTLDVPRQASNVHTTVTSWAPTNLAIKHLTSQYFKAEAIADKYSSPPSAPPPLVASKPGHHGPSPERGSGQDRLRRLLAEASGFLSTNAHTEPVPATSLSSGDIESNQMQSNPYYGSYHPSYPMRTGMWHPNYDHQIAVNPAMHPIDTSLQGASVPIKTEATSPIGYNHHDHAASRNGGNGKTGTRHGASDCGPTYTSILSAECQKRRFNPQFTEWSTPQGCKASVNINGRVIHGNGSFKVPNAAKQSVAKDAINYVRQLPAPSEPNGAAVKARLEQARMDRKEKHEGSRERDHPQANKISGYGYYPGIDDRRSQPRAQSEDDHKEDRHLLERIRSLYGRSVGPSESTMADPMAARAFLEGFALGGKLRESAYGHPRDAREASPSGGTRPYRERSPHSRASSGGRLR